MTMTPVTRGPNLSGTASSDSSISAVPAICSPNSWRGRRRRRGAERRSRRHARDTAADLRRQELDRIARRVGDEIAAEGDRNEVVLVAEEDAAVVVVDEEPELVRDREPDLLDVVEARELPGQALQHLHVRDRADVVAADASSAGRSRALSSNGTTSPLPRVFAVIIAASAQATSSRGLAAFSGPIAIPVETVSRPTASASSFAELLADPLGERVELRMSPDGRMTANSLAADAADDVGRAHGRAQDVGDLLEEVVADAVPVDVVDLLEVVEVEHHDGDGLVRGRRAQQLLAQAVVEGAVVVEARERVGLGLVLEARADVARCRSRGRPRRRSAWRGGTPRP